ncbi:MAG: prolyl oligopeptidase family serine peptidase [Byssovorax sp.]
MSNTARLRKFVVSSGPAPRREVWVYAPEKPGNRPLGLVLIAPAGGNFISAPGLGDSDKPEHLPYVEAGFAVVSYSIDGVVADDANDADFMAGARAYQASRGGIDNAVAALSLALEVLPSINREKIYAAGHSSSGSLALLVAAHDERIRGVVAYAPAPDLRAFVGANAEKLRRYLPDLPSFLSSISPIEHASELRVPIFLFHARDDGVISVQETAAYVKALRDAGAKLEFVETETGGHRNSMISRGIPGAVRWMSK